MKRRALRSLFLFSTQFFSAHRIKDASPQLRPTSYFLTPRAGGRVLGKNRLAQDSEKQELTRTGDPILKVKSIFGGSAVVCSALLTGSLIFSARPLAAETLLNQIQQQAQKRYQPPMDEPDSPRDTAPSTVALVETESKPIDESRFVVAPMPYIATAYSLRGRTASGRPVSKGLIAADPRFLPLGSRVRLEAGTYSGEYLVADTGDGVRGRRIDIWTPSTGEAVRFGRRTIKVTVLSYGGKRRAMRPATR
jgi:3D (Asp-Asp-Asp) domain-containing protein